MLPLRRRRFDPQLRHKDPTCHAALLEKEENVSLGFVKAKADFECGMFLTETTACKIQGLAAYA